MINSLSRYLLPALLWLGALVFFPSVSWSEDISIRYEFLDRQVGTYGELWSLQFEVFNKSHRPVQNISIDILADVTRFATGDPFWLNSLASPEKVLVAGDFSIPKEFLPPEYLPLKFYVVYETLEGTLISSIVEGQSTILNGEAVP